MGKSTVRVGSIVIDVDNFAQMMTVWQEALGYAPGRPPTPDDPFVILKDPTGKGPNVSIDQMEPYRGRLHLDLYTDDPDREVERLLQLGATVYRPREPGEDFVVLADPEGNLFCASTRGASLRTGGENVNEVMTSSLYPHAWLTSSSSPSATRTSLPLS